MLSIYRMLTWVSSVYWDMGTNYVEYCIINTYCFDINLCWVHSMSYAPVKMYTLYWEGRSATGFWQGSVWLYREFWLRAILTDNSDIKWHRYRYVGCGFLQLNFMAKLICWQTKCSVRIPWVNLVGPGNSHCKVYYQYSAETEYEAF